MPATESPRNKGHFQSSLLINDDGRLARLYYSSFGYIYQVSIRNYNTFKNIFIRTLSAAEHLSDSFALVLFSIFINVSLPLCPKSEQ